MRSQLDVSDLFEQTSSPPSDPPKNFCFLSQGCHLAAADGAPPSRTPRGSAQQNPSRGNAGLFTLQ